MDSPSFHEFKRKTSFFFKEQIKTARLAFTDVTPAEMYVNYFLMYRLSYHDDIIIEHYNI